MTSEPVDSMPRRPRGGEALGSRTSGLGPAWGGPWTYSVEVDELHAGKWPRLEIHHPPVGVPLLLLILGR